MLIRLYCFNLLFVNSILYLLIKYFFSLFDNFNLFNLFLFLVFLIFFLVINLPKFNSSNLFLILLESYPLSPINILLLFFFINLLLLIDSNCLIINLASFILPLSKCISNGIPLISVIKDNLDTLP